MEYKSSDFIDFQIINENVIIATAKRDGSEIPICKACYDKYKTISYVAPCGGFNYEPNNRYFCFNCDKEFVWKK